MLPLCAYGSLTDIYNKTTIKETVSRFLQQHGPLLALAQVSSLPSAKHEAACGLSVRFERQSANCQVWIAAI